MSVKVLRKHLGGVEERSVKLGNRWPEIHSERKAEARFIGSFSGIKDFQ